MEVQEITALLRKVTGEHRALSMKGGQAAQGGTACAVAEFNTLPGHAQGSSAVTVRCLPCTQVVAGS
jgi:hypothetical protein